MFNLKNRSSRRIRAGERTGGCWSFAAQEAWGEPSSALGNSGPGQPGECFGARSGREGGAISLVSSLYGGLNFSEIDWRMRELFQPSRLLPGVSNAYRSRMASTEAEVRGAQALRFNVFNLELKEGLESSYDARLDVDPFDAVCDHLIVEHVASGTIVGTYRLQTGESAQRHLGYYSNQEFDLQIFEAERPRLIELGRACVDRNHRNLAVLGFLWKGIANYTREKGGRYLFGCSSITSQDPAEGARAYAQLAADYLADPAWRAQPRLEYLCPMDTVAAAAVKIPKLLSAYLAIGARICGPPALDRDFKTIDFLTILDLDKIPAMVRNRFLA